MIGDHNVRHGYRFLHIVTNIFIVLPSPTQIINKRQKTMTSEPLPVPLSPPVLLAQPLEVPLLPLTVPTCQSALVDLYCLTIDKWDILTAENADIDNLLCWSPDKVEKWCTRKIKLEISRGGRTDSIIKVCNLHVFVFWCNYVVLRSRYPDVTTFDTGTLIKYKEIIRIYDLKKDTSSDVEMPNKLEPSTDWEDW